MSSRTSEEITALRPRLFQAAKSGNVQLLHQILDPGQVSGENDLRIALQKASEAGNEEAVQVLLGKGAKTDVITNKGLSPLHRAVERGHTGIIALLLNHGASPETRDQSGRTVYIWAALRGQNSILEFLRRGWPIDIDAVDNEGRTALHTLAADQHQPTDLSKESSPPKKQPINQPSKWNDETVRILLAAGIDLDTVDKFGRTALHWAAATGKMSLAAQLLQASAGRSLARVRATTDRGKTALHLAAENNHADMVRLLLNAGALKEAKSDGNWTALLNAARNGHEAVVDALLSLDADVNARTSSGMTALHWAAELGHLEVVKRILTEDKAWKNSKDSFDSTPLARAGQHGHQAIVQALRPHIFEGSLSPDAREACKRFRAAVVDFYYDGKTLKRSLVKKKTVYETLYAIDPKDPAKEKFAITTLIEDIASNPPDFRWIHLPANNVAWAEALITKFFLERGLKGATDAAGYKAMLIEVPAVIHVRADTEQQRIFGDQQHRGPKVHSRFMRPFCQRISDGQSQHGPLKRPKSRNQSPAKVDEPRVPTFAADTKRPVHRDIIVMFMPYLHWDTDYNRVQATQAIKRHNNAAETRRGSIVPTAKDEYLIRGYLNSSTDLHLRRTLDQFKHHSINTEKRDRDQVVFRFCKRAKKELKIFMVDQMWIWILGDNLVFTSFPDRWGQPNRDPLNLFDGLIEDINSKTKPPVRSVFELAALITDRCTGTFDRHHWNSEDYLFMEMFELSIGTMTRRETALFQRFERDSAAAAHWLKTHDRTPKFYLDESTKERDAEDSENEGDDWLKEDDDSEEYVGTNKFVDRLLNIASEAKLLVECKDVQDELGILMIILGQQRAVLHDMERVLKHTSGIPDDARRGELMAKVTQQQRSIDLCMMDLTRMDKQAESVNTNLTQVLDLKQKHANALEARFQRDQAQDTARQGQTIMIFTIVTIVFLPMSFIASFFAINIIDLPHNSSNGNVGLPLGFVAKYLFGIGLAVSIPLIVIAFVFTDMEGWIAIARRKLGLGKKRRPKGGRHHPPGAGGGEQPVEKHVTIDDPRYSTEWSIGRRPNRIGTDKTDRSRTTQDLEMG